MGNPDAGWWLSYNGEIYNHGALRDQLTDATFQGSSDTETLLWALTTWGVDALPRLSGQFAFAALDRHAGRVLLCRDRFGIKPLYVASCDEGVWFASEPGALLAAGVRADPVPDVWKSITTGSYLGGEATLLSGITRVDAGACLSISLDDTEVSVSRWHSPSDDVDPVRAEALGHLSRSKLTDELERTLRDAVHRSLLADATVGTLCSGGLDSSLITALAAEVKPDMVAFAASFKDEGAIDEGRAAERVAQALGIELELVDITPSDWCRAFVPATVHHGSPIANASAVTVSQLAAHAERRGVKVLMTGEGADELFGGYPGIHGATVEEFLSPAQRLIRRLEPKLLADPRRLLDLRRVARKLGQLAIPHSGGRPTESPWPSAMSPAIGDTRLVDAANAYAHHHGNRQTLEADLLSRLDFSLCWLLNRMDKNVMQTSVEARVPFLEPDVVELVLNLPLEIRVGPWSKGILRDVARRVLPWPIAHRPKIPGMDYDGAAWIEQAADPEFLHDGLLLETAKLGRDEFEMMLASADRLLRLRLWSAEVWCRSALDGQPIKDIELALWR